MHANAALLHELFDAIQRNDPETVVSCYHPDATFHDIAFDLHPRDKIVQMWRMIGSNGIKVKVKSVEANDAFGKADTVDIYRFGLCRRRVRNRIHSKFTFQGGKIIRQADSCDPKEWGRQAVIFPFGFLAGRSRLMRSLTARFKLWRFLRHSPG
jgi:ketosteroid isomerase-like protein